MSDQPKCRIFKYATRLLPGGVMQMEMPVECAIMHVGLQGDDLAVWALVPEGEIKMAMIEFYCLPTGVEVPDDAIKHTGTFQEGALVWHVFQRLSMEHREAIKMQVANARAM